MRGWQGLSGQPPERSHVSQQSRRRLVRIHSLLVGQFHSANVDKALAATVVSFNSAGIVSVEWQGEPALLVRSPAIYLHWMVLKDRKRDALANIETIKRSLLLGRASGDYWVSLMYSALNRPGFGRHFPAHSSSPVAADHGQVTITYNARYRCNPSFRPRTAVVRLVLPTFWALWNEVVEHVGEEPSALAALADDLLTQVELYERRGVGATTSGNTPWDAARIGASHRLAQEVAGLAGLTEQEFRALPERERDRVIAVHAGIDQAQREPETSSLSALPADLIAGHLGNPASVFKLWKSGDIFIYSDPREAIQNDTPGVRPVVVLKPGAEAYADALKKAVDASLLPTARP